MRKYVKILRSRFLVGLAEWDVKIWSFGCKYRTMIFATITILLFSLSYVITPAANNLERETKRLEHNVQKRQAILEEFAQQAMDTPIEEWLNMPDLPSDMVVYKYNLDTMQSWVNQFPITNDDINSLFLWYRLQYKTNINLHNAPLAYLGPDEQYVNLGSAWYVLKLYKKERVQVITGLLVKTEYLSNNSVLVSQINPKISKNNRLSINSNPIDPGYIVRGIGDKVLFTVTDSSIYGNTMLDSPLRWIGILFALITLCLFFYKWRSYKGFVLFFICLTILRYISFGVSESLRLDTNLFSPNIYADEGLFSSLGNLLLNNLYVFLISIAIFLLRRRIVYIFNGKSKILRILALIITTALPILLFLYINFTIVSVINNSSIVLEQYRVDEFTFYSFFIYLSYAFLFLGLFFLIQLTSIPLRRYRRLSLIRAKYVVSYLFAISLYMLLMITFHGAKKERERCDFWINKLSVERDIGLELELRLIEDKIVNDPGIKEVMNSNASQDAIIIIKNRLEEAFFSRLFRSVMSQNYDVKYTLCRPNEMLPILNPYSSGTSYERSGCIDYYDKLIERGTPIADNSIFYFINNYDRRVVYIARIPFNTISGVRSLFIEFSSSKYSNNNNYSAILFDYKLTENVNIPKYYSYAKYVDNKMVDSKGRYNYSLQLHGAQEEGFNSYVKDGYLHFKNTSANGNVIIVSRKLRPLLSYIVSMSYLFLFFSAFMFLAVSVKWSRKSGLMVDSSRNSFKRKITYLIVSSLSVALICMGLGSVWFSINYFNENNRAQMEDKLQNVHATLTDLCSMVDRYNDLNSNGIYDMLDNIALTNDVDINLYDPHGILIRSTQPELFERHLLSSRINSNVYKNLIVEKRRQIINEESIAEFDYYSLYTPIYNSKGTLIAIANIPYFSEESELTGEISSILATIINAYILLILIAILGGTMLSNQLAKPLAEISRKLKLVNVTKKTEHINYRNKDELGSLVAAYNKMIDDLEDSTMKLAQSEREHAWSEMARQIAHEIKNPLTPMRLSIQHLIRMKQNGVENWEDKFEKMANSIIEQIDILSDTASEFSSFAKFYYEDSSVINLYNIIQEQKILFDTRDNVRMIFSAEEQDYLVLARKGQIIRVIVNLLNNAIQAVEGVGRGYVKISLLQELGKYVVSIEDNGAGVKLEDRDKLFKPNFTTKSSGTGLGLAICRNIIEQSGGSIFYKDSDLGGANFSFNLPIYQNKI